ncbi:hypothetical protein ACOMHN_001616 [Nucella lapillus]
MEEELQFLREEVRHRSAGVQRLQTSLYDQQVRANVGMVALRTQLRNKDRHMQHVRTQHEQRMSALLTHLLYLEGQMRQEQRQVLELLHEKDDVIRRQKSAIEDLASKNARLLSALKEVHGYSGGNGISTPGGGGGGATPGAAEGAKAVAPPQVVLRNKDKDKGQKVRFGSVKDKLRRHKSSLELHRPASMDTLVEGTLRYGSQENLSQSSQRAVSPVTHRRKGSEGLCSDELKKTRQQERKERCNSLIDYPFRLNDLPEVSSEVERGRDESPLPDSFQDLSRSPLSSQSCQQLSTPQQNRNSLYSDDDEAFHSPQEGSKQYGELAKATSMPQSLASPSDQEVSPASLKERPHSLSGAELSLNMDKMSMLPMERVSMNPSPTSQEPPGGSDSNPFKSFKNVFRRRNSKRTGNKKRPVSLGQQTNQEYHEALKEHFKKYDLN